MELETLATTDYAFSRDMYYSSVLQGLIQASIKYHKDLVSSVKPNEYLIDYLKDFDDKYNEADKILYDLDNSYQSLKSYYDLILQYKINETELVSNTEYYDFIMGFDANLSMLYNNYNNNILYQKIDSLDKITNDGIYKFNDNFYIKFEDRLEEIGSIPKEYFKTKKFLNLLIGQYNNLNGILSKIQNEQTNYIKYKDDLQGYTFNINSEEKIEFENNHLLIDINPDKNEINNKIKEQYTKISDYKNSQQIVYNKTISQPNLSYLSNEDRLTVENVTVDKDIIRDINIEHSLIKNEEFKKKSDYRVFDVIYSNSIELVSNLLSSDGENYEFKIRKYNPLLPYEIILLDKEDLSYLDASLGKEYHIDSELIKKLPNETYCKYEYKTYSENNTLIIVDDDRNSLEVCNEGNSLLPSFHLKLEDDAIIDENDERNLILENAELERNKEFELQYNNKYIFTKPNYVDNELVIDSIRVHINYTDLINGEILDSVEFDKNTSKLNLIFNTGNSFEVPINLNYDNIDISQIKIDDLWNGKVISINNGYDSVILPSPTIGEAEPIIEDDSVINVINSESINYNGLVSTYNTKNIFQTNQGKNYTINFKKNIIDHKRAEFTQELKYDKDKDEYTESFIFDDDKTISRKIKSDIGQLKVDIKENNENNTVTYTFGLDNNNITKTSKFENAERYLKKVFYNKDLYGTTAKFVFGFPNNLTEEDIEKLSFNSIDNTKVDEIIRNDNQISSDADYFDYDTLTFNSNISLLTESNNILSIQSNEINGSFKLDEITDSEQHTAFTFNSNSDYLLNLPIEVHNYLNNSYVKFNKNDFISDELSERYIKIDEENNEILTFNNINGEKNYFYDSVDECLNTISLYRSTNFEYFNKEEYAQVSTYRNKVITLNEYGIKQQIILGKNDKSSFDLIIQNNSNKNIRLVLSIKNGYINESSIPIDIMVVESIKDNIPGRCNIKISPNKRNEDPTYCSIISLDY